MQLHWLEDQHYLTKLHHFAIEIGRPWFSRAMRSTILDYWESRGVPTIVRWPLGVLHCWKARMKAFIDSWQKATWFVYFPSIFEWIRIFIHPDSAFVMALVMPHVLFLGLSFLSQSLKTSPFSPTHNGSRRRDEPWLPRLLGGSGSTKACWTGYPFQEMGFWRSQSGWESELTNVHLARLDDLPLFNLLKH